MNIISGESQPLKVISASGTTNGIPLGIAGKFYKKNRIKKKKDFIKVLKNGYYIKEKYYICRFIENGLSESRIGIIVKKKLLNAVKRNYEKRVLREFFRVNKNTLKNNYDIVITVIENAGAFAEKKACFERILLKIR